MTTVTSAWYIFTPMSTDDSADAARWTMQQIKDGLTHLRLRSSGLNNPSASLLKKLSMDNLTMKQALEIQEALDREVSGSYRAGMIDADQAVHDTALRFCKMNVMDPCKSPPCEQHSALAGIAVQAVFEQLPPGVVMGGDWRTAERLWNGRHLYKIDQHARDRTYDRSAQEEKMSERSAPEADLISSRVLGDAMVAIDQNESMHMPAIDVDLPVYAVRSDTPGHSHLYIQQQMKWPVYLKLLEAMAEAGIVEKNYVEMSRLRGASFLYMPGKGRGPRREARSDYWG